MTTPTTRTDNASGYGTPARRAYVIVIFLVIYAFNFIDRSLLTVLQEPIRREFGLSDAHLGLMAGPTFALFYTFLGIPIARLADRGPRVTILSVCIGLWSLMTSLCGMATSFATLLLPRIGVGVGEAGCAPTATSVFADYFPPERRATAVAIFTLGVPIGTCAAALGGGYLAQNLGWRDAFLALGIPGILLAVLARATIPEPPRTAPADEHEGFGGSLRILAGNRTLWLISLASGIASFTGYGVGQFNISFFIRNHHLTIFQASTCIGLIVGVFGGLGVFLSGFIADQVAKRHPNGLAWLPALGLFVAAPTFVAGYLSQTIWVAVPLLSVATLFSYFYVSASYAATQIIVHPRMRATAVAILGFFTNLIGLGLGPPVIGAMSDLLASRRLVESGLTITACRTPALIRTPLCQDGIAHGLKYAIIFGYCGFAIAAFVFLLAWRTMPRDRYAERSSVGAS